ncbi:MAG: Imm44 family immunity protein [Planctomycetota bacterium]
MIFFMSSESDRRFDDFEEPLRRIRNEIEEKIKKYIENKDYGNEVSELSIIPIIVKFNKQMEEEGWFKERKLFKRKSKEADVRLRIDYDRFVNGNNNVKKMLLIGNIIKSIEALSSKARDFKAQELVNDILKLFGLNREDLAEYEN